MPTYDYACDACGHLAEIFHAMSEKPVSKCPKCRSRRFRRLIGSGGAIIFKGSGFYGTDYRSESYHSDAKKDSAPSSCSGNPSKCDGPCSTPKKSD